MQKIRIFALAKELNMDSKDLIEACAKVGVILKNSALASISPEEKDKVLDFLKQSSSVSAPAAKAAPVPPVREAVKSFDKPLQNWMTPRSHPARLTPKQRAAAGDSEQGEDSSVAVATAEPPIEAPGRSDTDSYSGTSDDESITTTATTSAETLVAPTTESSSTATAAPAETVASSAAAVEATAKATVAEPVVELATDELAGDVDTPGPVEAVEGEVATGMPVKRNPLRRDDYIAPAGGRRPVYNMKPQGTVDMSKAANEAVNAKKSPKTRPGPILPTFAPMPEFRGPTITPQPAAQKPDMRLPTGTTINDVKPLQNMLQKHKGHVDAKKVGDDPESVVDPFVFLDPLFRDHELREEPDLRRGLFLPRRSPPCRRPDPRGQVDEHVPGGSENRGSDGRRSLDPLDV